MQILVATRPITARVGYIAFYKIEFVLLLESVHNACKFEVVIILVLEIYQKLSFFQNWT